MITVSVPVLAMGGVSIQEIASGALAILTISAFVRASAITDVRVFIAQQTNEQSQQQMGGEQRVFVSLCCTWGVNNRFSNNWMHVPGRHVLVGGKPL